MTPIAGGSQPTAQTVTLIVILLSARKTKRRAKLKKNNDNKFCANPPGKRAGKVLIPVTDHDVSEKYTHLCKLCPELLLGEFGGVEGLRAVVVRRGHVRLDALRMRRPAALLAVQFALTSHRLLQSEKAMSKIYGFCGKI